MAEVYTEETRKRQVPVLDMQSSEQLTELVVARAQLKAPEKQSKRKRNNVAFL